MCVKHCKSNVFFGSGRQRSPFGMLTLKYFFLIKSHRNYHAKCQKNLFKGRVSVLEIIFHDCFTIHRVNAPTCSVSETSTNNCQMAMFFRL